MKQRMEEEEMKECTFRPSLSHKSLQLTGKLFRNNLTRLKELGGLSSTSKIDDTINFSGLSTSKIVYTDKNYMKSKATVSSNRSREEIEFERQKSHCTFKPKIIKLYLYIYNHLEKQRFTIIL